MLFEFAKNYPALLSVTAVALGWFATRRGQIQSDRAKHSHSYIDFLNSDEYKESLKIVAPLLDKKETYIEDQYSEGDRKRISGAIWDLLQAMERAAIAIDLGYISEDYFYKMYSTLLERIFVVSYELINKIRLEKSSPTIFKNFEALYIRFHYRKKPYFAVVLEYLFVCPNLRMTGSIFSAYTLTRDRSVLVFLFEILKSHPLPKQINHVKTNDIRSYNKKIREFRNLELLFITTIYLSIYLKL